MRKLLGLAARGGASRSAGIQGTTKLAANVEKAKAITLSLEGRCLIIKSKLQTLISQVAGESELSRRSKHGKAKGLATLLNEELDMSWSTDEEAIESATSTGHLQPYLKRLGAPSVAAAPLPKQLWPPRLPMAALPIPTKSSFLLTSLQTQSGRGDNSTGMNSSGTQPQGRNLVGRVPLSYVMATGDGNSRETGMIESTIEPEMQRKQTSLSPSSVLAPESHRIETATVALTTTDPATVAGQFSMIYSGGEIPVDQPLPLPSTAASLNSVKITRAGDESQPKE